MRAYPDVLSFVRMSHRADGLQLRIIQPHVNQPSYAGLSGEGVDQAIDRQSVQQDGPVANREPRALAPDPLQLTQGGQKIGVALPFDHRADAHALAQSASVSP